MSDVAAALTVAEAADRYSVSQKRIRAAILAGELPAKNISEGQGIRVHPRVLLADLQTWFNGLPNA